MAQARHRSGRQGEAALQIVQKFGVPQQDTEQIGQPTALPVAFHVGARGAELAAERKRAVKPRVRHPQVGGKLSVLARGPSAPGVRHLYPARSKTLKPLAHLRAHPVVNSATRSAAPAVGKRRHGSLGVHRFASVG